MKNYAVVPECVLAAFGVILRLIIFGRYEIDKTYE
jgi:hypothetical protein